MEYTTNLQLKKPEATDLYDIGNENDNMDALDTIITAQGTSISGKAPTSHASSSNTYGVGSKTQYGHVKVDDALNSASENPVQNKVVKTGLDAKQDKLHQETKIGTLAAGSTTITLTFTSETIGSDTLVDLYTDPFGVNPNDAQATSTTVTLTFDSQNAAVKVGVTITN